MGWLQENISLVNYSPPSVDIVPLYWGIIFFKSYSVCFKTKEVHMYVTYHSAAHRNSSPLKYNIGKHYLEITHDEHSLRTRAGPSPEITKETKVMTRAAAQTIVGSAARRLLTGVGLWGGPGAARTSCFNGTGGESRVLFAPGVISERVITSPVVFPDQRAHWCRTASPPPPRPPLPAEMPGDQ